MSRWGEGNANWKGGRKRAGHAMKYWAIYAPDHPAACKGYVLEHRLVMERVLGRHLRDDEVVHHLNGDPGDNRPENLAVMARSDHTREHSTKPPEERTCPGCGVVFVVHGHKARRHKYCSTPCAQRNRRRLAIKGRAA